jgi:hypothetical protein
MGRSVQVFHARSQPRPLWVNKLAGQMAVAVALIEISRPRRCTNFLFLLLLMLTGCLPGVKMSSAATPSTTQTMDIRFGEHTFRVPINYLSPRPASSAPGGAIAQNFMRLAFQMPSGLSVPRDVATSLDLREHKNVDLGSEHRFVVVVADVRAISDVNAPPSPETQLRNVIGLGSELFDYDRSFGALHIVPDKAGPDIRQYYYGSADFSLNYFIHCDKDLTAKPNPLCNGDIRYESVGLIGHLIFTTEEISQIKNIAITSEKLLRSWRVN